MRRLNIYLILISAIYSLPADTIATQDYNVGFRNIDSRQAGVFSGGVWYPSTDQEFKKKWGPFRPVWAWNGNPVKGKRPAVLLSHGVMGRYRNHRDTAETLAQKGYIVIIPQHTKDRWVGTDKTLAVVEHRIAELSRSLSEFTLAEPEIAELIDPQKIGAIGYSLGGLTVLGSAGAMPSTKYVEEHCLKNSQNDPNFCLGDFSWWERIWLWIAGTDLVHWLYETELESKDIVHQVEPAVNFRAIAIVAPVAAAYYPEQVRNIDAKIAIFRLESDQINRFPFHSDYIHQSLGQREHLYKVYKDAHHFAFISPFPEWLLKEETIPVAIDPEGFNREKFLDEINTDILNFFQEVMPAN